MKQYQQLFALNKVKLEFNKNALEAMADLAIKRNTGARGLRSIIESTLMETMYEVPSRDDIRKVVVTKKAVEGQQQPLFYSADGSKVA